MDNISELAEKDLAELQRLVKVVERRIITGHKRYAGTFRKYGSIMNFYNIARKYIRLENKFHFKLPWFNMKGDKLLDCYIDIIIYGLIGILLSKEDDEISENDITNILKEAENEKTE